MLRVIANQEYEKLQNWFTQLCIKPTGFLVDIFVYVFYCFASFIIAWSTASFHIKEMLQIRIALTLN